MALTNGTWKHSPHIHTNISYAMILCCTMPFMVLHMYIGSMEQFPPIFLYINVVLKRILLEFFQQMENVLEGTIGERNNGE